jgi:hypothetical protein
MFPTLREINFDIRRCSSIDEWKLGNQLEIDCRAYPGDRAGLPVVFSWRWIANGAVVVLAYIVLKQGNCIERTTSIY